MVVSTLVSLLSVHTHTSPCGLCDQYQSHQQRQMCLGQRVSTVLRMHHAKYERCNAICWIFFQVIPYEWRRQQMLAGEITICLTSWQTSCMNIDEFASITPSTNRMLTVLALARSYISKYKQLILLTYVLFSVQSHITYWQWRLTLWHFLFAQNSDKFCELCLQLHSNFC